jgi:hypothetical protein
MYFFLKGRFIALININHTYKLQKCCLINQFTAVSLQLHVGEFDLEKNHGSDNHYTIHKNTATNGWNYNKRCLMRLWMYFLYRCWKSTIEQSPIVGRGGFNG